MDGCKKCGQLPNGQTGEYPCSECGIPTVHDRSTITPERAIVIDAPPGSILVFVMKHPVPLENIERLRAWLPEYRVIVTTDLEDIRAIVPHGAVTHVS